ncbi:MAG TPA: tyrosine-type recombinase/integrase [Blastocatellia bacterium]|jgi:integrase|nr:tyrosine-type recombinase/integrase [Blastocatellia bacterium]
MTRKKRSRRPNHTGAIVTRGKGRNQRLYVRVRYRDETGRVREKFERIISRSDASTAAARAQEKLARHGPRIYDGERMTFSDLAREFAEARVFEPEYHGETKIAGLRSWRDTESKLQVLTEYFGSMRLRSITHRDLEAFKLHRLQMPVEPPAPTSQRGQRRRSRALAEGRELTRPRAIASVNRELELLRAVLNFAHRNGWILRNPFTLGPALISKADETRRDRVLSRDEEARLLAACTGPREHLRPLIICALDTGMRRGEMLKLTWADVHLQDGWINVRKKTTKTAHRRVVGISPRLRQEFERLWWLSDQKETSLVFGIRDNFKRAFNTACRLAEIEDLHFHDLRHTADTRMTLAGVPLPLVMKVLGHTQVNTSLSYKHVDTRTAAEIAALLETQKGNAAFPFSRVIQQPDPASEQPETATLAGTDG